MKAAMRKLTSRYDRTDGSNEAMKEHSKEAKADIATLEFKLEVAWKTTT